MQVSVWCLLKSTSGAGQQKCMFSIYHYCELKTQNVLVQSTNYEESKEQRLILYSYLATDLRLRGIVSELLLASLSSVQSLAASEKLSGVLQRVEFKSCSNNVHWPFCQEENYVVMKLVTTCNVCGH